MKGFRCHIAFALIILAFSGFGQISPGPLSQAHADLEGLSNCTQCHDLGNKVPDSKCLDCHVEINDLLRSNRGYHSSSEVKSKNCTSCHNEHHGRKFDMVRFDEDNFNHNLTGYELEGAHKKIDCRQCHLPDNIEDPELKNRKDTYLGLKSNCLSCHEDFHQNTLDNDCRKCHDLTAFRPASLFDHDDSSFKLKGRHLDVSCIECHPNEERNGLTFQKFVDIAYNDCKSCHTDVHKNQLPGRCDRCHTEKNWNIFIGQNRFNHGLTNFDLAGAHRETSCFDCHDKNEDPSSIFQDRKDVLNNDCIACHDDIHEGKFGVDCASCHTETSFLALKNMDAFNHDLTNYPLEGRHYGVDCKACHKERYTDPLEFSNCYDCHEDYHLGEFIQNQQKRDCDQCHTIDEEFSFTLYGIDEHELSTFPLTGSHLATPCFACHVSEDHWTFRNIGESCIDCHDNIHEGYIEESYMQGGDCTSCHITDSWAAIIFDHDETGWKLDGLHLETKCRSCHFEMNNDQSFKQKFTDLSTDCYSCHNNPHGTQFESSGITDCKRCHITTGWNSEFFDHSKTRFPLEGKHSELECAACHPTEIQNDGEERVLYKIEKLECIDCHS